MRRVVAIVVALAMVGGGCSSGAAESSTTETTGGTSSTVADTTTPTTTGPPTAADLVVTRLAGLPFDEFADRSFEELLLRSPQLVTELGINDRLGSDRAALDDLSDGFVADTMEIESAVLDLLHGFDRASLDPNAGLTYDVYEWYLDDLVRGHPFVHHDYPLHHSLGSYHWNTFFYFTDTFPLATVEDAEDFVTAVGQVGRQAVQVLDGLEIREAMGIYPPDFIVEMVREAMKGQLGMRTLVVDDVDPTANEIYRRFEEDTAGLGLDSGRRDGLLDDLKTAISESVAPAWIDLITYLDHLRGIAGSDAGVWKLPDGEAYYAYLLHRETSTDLTAAEIHALGLAEVDRVRGELRDVFEGLGYGADISLSDALTRVVVEGGVVDTRVEGPEAVIDAYQGYLARIEPALDAVFDLQPAAPLAIEADRSFGGGGGFYSPGSLDGTRPGAFYAGSAPGAVARYQMATILHHEGVPGHHFQIALAQELGLPLMRSVVNFNGYVEGWAVYAEYLAEEMGVYDDDPYGDVGRLYLELLRAVRLVADTGIHSVRWTRQEAGDYMIRAMEGWTHEVDRYIVMPAQATGYKVGMLEILRLRGIAEREMGDAFDLAGFHDVVIGHGSLPLEILGRLVDEWIAGGS
ncbi:MAG: DUF885 domain-containing protein [Actinobacteria bacterium]|nr:DUF885 domain-containing protein [Actinomycetota bacterium]